MRRLFPFSLAAAALAASAAVHAQDHADHQKHMMSMAGDSRQLVSFPPEMRQHTLTNMRDHLQALADILTALAAARYTEAAEVAATRLGMESPSAEGCQADEAPARPAQSRPASMDHRMAQFMPEPMRRIGMEMHQAASAFSGEAAKAGRSGDPGPALAALSRVTRQCAACHEAYRLQ